jgi:hypothetical protein
MGIKGCLLTTKLIMVLSCPQLGVDLQGMGSRLLLHLVSLLLIEEELYSYLGYHGPHYDRWDHLERRSILRHRSSSDRVNWGHHIAQSGARVSRAPPDS